MSMHAAVVRVRAAVLDPVVIFSEDQAFAAHHRAVHEGDATESAVRPCVRSYRLVKVRYVLVHVNLP